MSSHQCSLGKLAQRGASLQISPLATTMRSFYHSRSRPMVVQSLGQLSQWSKPAVPDNGLFGRSRVRKIVGVKKTLVNQMQGVAPSLGPSKVAPYKIYGKTRLFSSSSSLQSRSQLQQHPEQEEDQEEYSDRESLPPNTTASLSATQRRYNQATGFGKGMAMQAARDISQSIQEELMVVDAGTRDMLNCDRGRQTVRDYHDQLTHRPKSLADPMSGWKHPRPLKHLSSASASSAGESSSSGPVAQSQEQVDRQVRPRRRQIVIGQANRNRETQARSLTPLPQFSAQPKFELHAASAKEKFSEQRSELRPPTSWHSPKPAVEEKPEDLLMDVALARAVRPDITVARGLPKSGEDRDTESDSWYEQPKAERDFLKQTILGGGRSRQRAGQPRLDDLHYDSADNAAQISASQQVINQKYAGFRKSVRGNQKQMIRQIVEPVNPTPQLSPSARAMSEPRDPRKRRGSMRQDVGRQVTPKFFGAYRRSDAGEQREEGEDEDETGDGDSEERPRESGLSRSLRPGQTRSNWPSPHSSLHQMTTRSDTRLDSEQRGRGRNVMGEKRGPKKMMEPPAEHNDIGMPQGYKKESAVQRLGSASSKHNSRAFNSY
uniref:Nucleolar and coiled-body phosphoprotein 1 n=1 Tax=Drosophila rhopaloa TaxID=1041015 RepID=A0A6P4E8V3_DRORH